MRSPVHVVLAGILTLLTCVVAPPPARAQDSVQAAKERFDAGKKAFRLRDFDEAIKDWREGYQLKGDPIFLFNIAQAYREKKDFDNAIYFYESYLKEAKDPPNRQAVEQRLAEMKKLVEQSGGPPSGPIEPDRPKAPNQDTVTTPVKPPPPEANPPKEVAPPYVPKVEDQPGDVAPRPGRTMKIAGITVGAVGLVAIGVGVVFAMSASSIEGEIRDARAAHQPWTDALQSKDDSGRTAAMLSQTTFGVGAAALIGGGVLYYLGMKKDRAVSSERAATIQPTIGPHQVGVVFAVRY